MLKQTSIFYVTIPWSHNCIKMTYFKIKKKKTWEKAYAAAAGEMRHGD
jgi:hypothetical protein